VDCGFDEASSSDVDDGDLARRYEAIETTF
jgi:hypothetical protein